MEPESLWRGGGLDGISRDRYSADVPYSIGEFDIDERTYEVRRGGERLSVEPQVLELLLFLIERREQVVTKEEIFEVVWKGRIVSESALSSRIKAIRKLLGDDGVRQDIVRTVYGRGFRFVGEISNGDAAGKPGREPPTVSATTPATTSWEVPVTRYVSVDDVHVAYQVFGEGPLEIVLVPGFISNVDISWENPECAAWLRGFATYARVVMFDKRGTGLSDRVSRLPTMDERMEDVRAVMDAVGMDAAALIGISEGGSLATLFAASHPERCRALILIGSFAKALDATEEGIERFAKYVRKHWGTGRSLPNFAPSLIGNTEFERWWGRFERMGASHAAVIDLIRMNSQIDIEGVLSSVHVPTLVVHRSHDVLIDVAAGKQLSEGIPGARLLSLPSKDHIPWVGTTVAEEASAMREFLEHAVRALPEPDRVLATVVVIDTRSREKRLEPAQLRPLQEQLQQHRGGPLLEIERCWVTTFDAPGRAVRFATSVRQNIPLAQLGVHTGEVRIFANRVEGFAVSLASDIARRAAPGEVVVSRTVTDLIVGSNLQFEDLGAHQLEGVPAAWHLYRVQQQPRP